MSCRLFIRPEVESDIREAAEHYEREASPELAKDFVREIRKAIRRITENPLLFMVRHERLQVRWVFPKRFPYRAVFVVKGDIVTVLCVVHAKRHDRVWRSRI
jgi:plasmid stabilization system protein ParE